MTCFLTHGLNTPLLNALIDIVIHKQFKILFVFVCCSVSCIVDIYTCVRMEASVRREVQLRLPTLPRLYVCIYSRIDLCVYVWCVCVCVRVCVRGLIFGQDRIYDLKCAEVRRQNARSGVK